MDLHHEALHVLPAVLAQFGLDDVILFGHSECASIVIVYAGARPGRVRALASPFVGRLNLRAPGAREQLERWLAQPQMLGARETFHTEPFIDWLDDGSIAWFWTARERLGIPVMALVPGIVTGSRRSPNDIPI